MKMVCNETASRGKVFIKNSTFASDNVVIIIGVAGEIKGQVFFSMNNITACNIASTMMFGTEVKELDDMAKSAIAELGNMIMGNVSTEFFNNGIKIDITPPTVLVGKDMALSTRGLKTICIPLLLEKLGKIEIDVALTEY